MAISSCRLKTVSDSLINKALVFSVHFFLDAFLLEDGSDLRGHFVEGVWDVAGHSTIGSVVVFFSAFAVSLQTIQTERQVTMVDVEEEEEAGAVSDILGLGSGGSDGIKMVGNILIWNYFIFYWVVFQNN